MLAIKKNDKKMVLTSWGKSMYGGWYCNYYIEDSNGNTVKYDGFGGKTIADICQQAGTSRSELQHNVTRWDN